MIKLFIFFKNKATNFFLVNCLETAYVTGQKDQQTQILSGQIVILAGNCPVTGRYFEPWKLNCNFQRGSFKKIPSVWEVKIFSGTAQYLL